MTNKLNNLFFDTCMFIILSQHIRKLCHQLHAVQLK